MECVHYLRAPDWAQNLRRKDSENNEGLGGGDYWDRQGRVGQGP